MVQRTTPCDVTVIEVIVLVSSPENSPHHSLAVTCQINLYNVRTTILRPGPVRVPPLSGPFLCESCFLEISISDVDMMD